MRARQLAKVFERSSTPLLRLTGESGNNDFRPDRFRLHEQFLDPRARLYRQLSEL